VPNDRAGFTIRCSGCDAEFQAPAPEPDEASARAAYAVQSNTEGDDPAGAIHDFVTHVTTKAAKQLRRKPYVRKRFPVDLLVGVLLFACALGIFLFVRLREGGMMNTLINGILLPMIFVIAGGFCLLSWWRK
jgi:hypothetical protein